MPNNIKTTPFEVINSKSTDIIVNGDNDGKASKTGTSSTVDSSKFGTNDLANVSATKYNFEGVELTKNPRMSYYEAKTKVSSAKDGLEIAKKMSGVPEGFSDLPPSFHNTVVYAHRAHVYEDFKNSLLLGSTNQRDIDTLSRSGNSKEQSSSFDTGFFRLGTCVFRIPPEFITVSSTSNHTAIQTMRSSSSLMTKHSYVEREISVSLILNGMDQINGYEVNSPFDYPHYVDGLRTLLGQFKYTPFVPVENMLLNLQHNIHVVSLKNITVETVDDFPNTLSVTLTLGEFNAMPYTLAPNWSFNDSINWDLFNFYIQRNIRDSVIGLKKISTPSLTNKVKFKLLDSGVVDKDYSSDDLILKNDDGTTSEIDLLKDKYYNTIVDSEKDNLIMTKLTFATGNKLPKIQLSYHESPTNQFMGGTDTEFIMQFETTNASAIGKLEKMNSDNLALVRENKHKTGIGFIKVENELINLTGTNYIVIGNITSSTVPNFPGLYTITVSGTSFDLGAKDREKFKAMRPFWGSSPSGEENKSGGDASIRGRKGTEKDLIKQTKRGLANKVIQESCIEGKLMMTEMYPDLRLPKYSAVDWALSKIAKWRKNNGLEDLPFTKMPRPKSIIPGKGAQVSEYNGYVDPDFYMTYPFQIGEMEVLEPTEGSINAQYKKTAKAIFGTEDGTFDPNVKSIKEIRSNVLSGLIDGSINAISTLFISEPSVDKIKEPEFVPGFEPENQLRFHTGNIKKTNSDEELIKKLNSWVNASATGTVTNIDQSLSLDISTGQPGDNTKNPKQVKYVTGNPFVDLLINRAGVGCGYVYGATQNGDVCTQSYIDARRRLYPGYSSGYNTAKKWIGRQVWDCSSFVCWGLIRIGLKPSTFKITSGMWGPYSTSSSITKSQLKVGDLLYGGGHIVVYIGDDKVVNAANHTKGCSIDPISYHTSGSKCQKICRVKGLEDACKKFLEANPDFYIKENTDSSSKKDSNSSSNSSSSSNKSSKLLTKTNEIALSASKNSLTRKPAEGTTASSTSTTTSTGNSYSTGEPVLGKFGSEAIYAQLLDDNGKERSSKTKYVGTNTDRWDSLILKHAKTYNLDPNLVKCFIVIESGGVPNLWNSSNCAGLMQIHQSIFPIKPTPLDPEANIKMGCKILYDYGKYKSPKVNFDKERWIIAYNAGPGTLKDIDLGKKKVPIETKNYIRAFDALYARLVKNGAKPGATLTPTVGGMVNPPLPDGSSSESGITTTQEVDVDVKVWFELPKEDELYLKTDDLKNLFSGTLRSQVKALINPATLGVAGAAWTIAKAVLGSSSKSDGSTSGKEKSLQNSYLIQNQKSTRDIIQDGLEMFPNQVPTPDDVTNVIEDGKPTQSEFGVGLIDSLSDGELNFDQDKVSKIEDFQNDDNVIERMFVDSTTYGMKGRLARAFPSYIFLIIDEHAGWVDATKLWSNYYLYQSVVDIDIHEAYDLPISTAKVTLTNMNNNIRKYKKVKSTNDMVNESYGFINRFTYKYFGSIIDEKVTDELLELRNELHEEIFLKEGYRIHIRLGYGSNPANYAPMFSGVISEIMDGGELVTIAAQSDGAELVSSVVTDRTNATNKDIKLPEEPSDIIASLLCNRENEFLYQISGGNWSLDNTYGICHFGFYSSGDVEGSPFVDSETQLEGLGLATGAVTGGATAMVVGGLVGGLPALLAGGAVGTVAGVLAAGVRRDRMEYDIVKNIYKGTFDGKYIYDSQFLWFDGETNMRFFCYNKTPWDIMKMCEKMMPEFVCYPRNFGFEYRLFYGLPWWQHKYRYERDDSKNAVYELSKTFAQVNPLNSFSDIIDNRIRIDTTNLATNMIGIYSLGGDLASTPVIMSDWTIDRDKQTTKTIDTTSTQDFKGIPSIIDKALEWSGAFDNGKHNAIRVCVSELIDSWKHVYAGELITLGAPEVRVYNYLQLDDLYANMKGTCQVRETVHSMSGSNGYTTTIIPGLIASSNLKTAGTGPIMRSISQCATTVVSYTIGAGTQSFVLAKIGSMIKAADSTLGVLKYGKTAVSFLKSTGFSILKWARKGQAIGKLGSILKTAGNAVSASRFVGPILSLLGIGGTAGGFTAAGLLAAAGSIAVGAAAIVGAFILGSLIVKLITGVFDMFAYRNCINLFPMTIEERYLIGGATGQQNLLPKSDDEESE